MPCLQGLVFYFFFGILVCDKTSNELSFTIPRCVSKDFSVTATLTKGQIESLPATDNGMQTWKQKWHTALSFIPSLLSVQLPIFLRIEKIFFFFFKKKFFFQVILYSKNGDSESVLLKESFYTGMTSGQISYIVEVTRPEKLIRHIPWDALPRR